MKKSEKQTIGPSTVAKCRKHIKKKELHSKIFSAIADKRFTTRGRCSINIIKERKTHFPELLTERTEYESCGAGVLICFLDCFTSKGSADSDLPASDKEAVLPRVALAMFES